MPRYTLEPQDASKNDPIALEAERLDASRWRVTLPDGTTHLVDLYSPAPQRLHLLFPDHGAQAFDLGVRRHDGQTVVDFPNQERHSITVLTERQRRMQEASGSKARGGGPELKSPMAGKVIAVDVNVGAQVAQGDRVLIIEAMKMENDLKAHLGGTVVAVHVTPNDTVNVGDVLLEIEPAKES